ncbi:hypothetical protein WG908_16275 [Sphingobium sp. AN641]
MSERYVPFTKQELEDLRVLERQGVPPEHRLTKMTMRGITRKWLEQRC